MANTQGYTKEFLVLKEKEPNPFWDGQFFVLPTVYVRENPDLYNDCITITDHDDLKEATIISRALDLL